MHIKEQECIVKFAVSEGKLMKDDTRATKDLLTKSNLQKIKKITSQVAN